MGESVAVFAVFVAGILAVFAGDVAEYAVVRADEAIGPCGRRCWDIAADGTWYRRAHPCV